MDKNFAGSLLSRWHGLCKLSVSLRISLSINPIFLKGYFLLERFKLVLTGFFLSLKASRSLIKWTQNQTFTEMTTDKNRNDLTISLLSSFIFSLQTKIIFHVLKLFRFKLTLSVSWQDCGWFLTRIRIYTPSPRHTRARGETPGDGGLYTRAQVITGRP